MRETRLIMGMPITLEVLDESISADVLEKIFAYFHHVDDVFSTYKPESEMSLINSGKKKPAQYSREMKTIFELAEKTKDETNGYFDIRHNGLIDPSGIVKGWAIFEAAKKLKTWGFHHFYIDAGGDIQVSGLNSEGKVWRVGIKNPFNEAEIIKILYIKDRGVATSGNYIRGEHIYNPKEAEQSSTKAKSKPMPLNDLVSLTVIGPNVYEADRFATAAFAMGQEGIQFIERLPNFEAYMVDKNGLATMTTGFEKYEKN